MTTPQDPFDLERFVTAQRFDYPQALRELQAGRKQSHWMWYVFPQLHGLGRSARALRFGIKGLAEARAYLAQPLLGPRLIECAEAILGHAELSANAILGDIDALKLKSSATLFELASPTGSVFTRILEQFYHGVRDDETVRRLRVE